MTSLSPFPATDDASASGLIVPAILCGGSGSRLWPVSRKDFAKQHVPILGGASPFQRTLERLGAELFAEPIVISAATSRFLVSDQAAEVGTSIEIALEPQGRDTLPAVTLAACLAARRDPRAIVLVMPSDHLIPDVAAFERTVAAAARAARDGRIVVLGIAPTEPSSAYGYIAKPFTEYTAKDFEAVLATNTAGFYHITQAAVAEMLRQGSGHVVTVTTSLVDHANSSVPSVLASLTKGGLNAATKSLAIEYATRGIRANAVSPGIIKTPMHPAETHKTLAKLHPVGRLGEVRDVVDAVLYLDSAPFVTGEILHVDGGQSAGH